MLNIFFLAVHLTRLSTRCHQKSGTHGWENNLSAGPRNASQQAEELPATRDSLWNGVEDALAYITPLRVARAILLSHIWVITCELHSIVTKLTLQIPAPPTVSPPSVIQKKTPKVKCCLHKDAEYYVSRLSQRSNICTYNSANYRKKAVVLKALLSQCDRCVFDGEFCPISSPPAG